MIRRFRTAVGRKSGDPFRGHAPTHTVVACIAGPAPEEKIAAPRIARRALEGGSIEGEIVKMGDLVTFLQETMKRGRLDGSQLRKRRSAFQPAF